MPDVEPKPLPIPQVSLVVQPITGLSGPKTLKDYGQLLHTITLALVPVLVGLGLVTNDHATQWVALGFAILDPLFSSLSTPDKLRAVIYGSAGLLQALLIGFGTVSSDQAVTISGAAVTVLISIMATFYTPTSQLVVTSSQE